MHKKIRLICALLCFLYPVLSSASTPVLTPALPASEAPPSTQQAVLEAKINAEKEIRQKDQEKVELQIQGFDKRIGDKTQELDKRIEDIGSSIDRFGILLTVFGGLLTALLVGFGYLSFRKAGDEAEKAAKEAAEQWFKKNNESLDSKLKSLDSKVKALEVEVVEKRNKVNELGKKIQQEIQAPLSNLSGGNPSETTEEARKSNEALVKEADLLRHKPEADYSFDDWNTRALNAFKQQNLTAAVTYWTNAAKLEDASELQITQAILNKGLALSYLKRFVEAITAYDDVIERFGDVPEPDLRETLARAMVNKGISLGNLNRFAETIAACDEVIERFGVAPELVLREALARAMVSKGFALSRLNRFVEAIAVYDKVIKRLGKEPEPELREMVAQAMFNKGVTLGELNEHEKAIVAYDKVISDFGEAPEPELQKIVANAKQLRAELSSPNQTNQ